MLLAFSLEKLYFIFIKESVGVNLKAVLVDYRISDEEMNNLTNLNFEVLPVPPSQVLYSAVCGHPDMLLHILEKNTILLHKDINKTFTNKLHQHGCKILYSHSQLNSAYPFDIILNAVNLDNLFIHNIKYTDVNLLNQVKHKKQKSVKQGYTKCSTAVLCQKAVMTSDAGICKCLLDEGIDVLLLPPGDILLPGLNYGFIGGCCGLIEKDVLAFYGHLDNYAYKQEIYKFLKKHKVEPVFLSKGKLIDRGSIFVI